MQQALLQQTEPKPPGGGAQAVWIGAVVNSPNGADFVAPHHHQVPGLVSDLMALPAESICPRWPRSRSPMPSSRRSTRSRTGTGEPDVLWCTRCCATTG